MKRSSTDYNAALKRARGPLVAGGRLCDLPAAVDLFTDVTNAEGARQKGFFGGRAAKEKYEEVCARAQLSSSAPRARARTHARARCTPAARSRSRPRPLAR